MKRFLSISPVVAVLFIFLFISGFHLPFVSAPATPPFGGLMSAPGLPLRRISPPEGGINPTHNQILLKPQINPPSGGQAGLKAMIQNSSGEHGGKAAGQGDVKAKNPIKIGLLIQTNSSIEAKNGAEIAIGEANKKGGYKGEKFELVVKSMEGPWGTGSKQAVDMIFTDEVVAIVGSHDGRNAHLVEQATTKANITFLSAWSGDPTLSQAFTPWFFTAVPNSNQQADMLMEEIAGKKYKNVIVVQDDDYDANSSFKSFVRKSAEKGSVKPVIIKAEKSESDLSGIAEKISRPEADCILLFTGPANAVKIISGLIKMKNSPLVYGPLSLLGEFSEVCNYPEVSANLLLLSSGDWYKNKKSQFAAGYHEKFGTFPGATAAYAFDAMMVMINAVKAAGGVKEKVQKAMMRTDYKGATGTIKFDEKGNRICPVVTTK